MSALDTASRLLWEWLSCASDSYRHRQCELQQSEERFLASSTPPGITQSLLSKPSSFRCVRVYFHLEAVGDSQIGGGKSDVVEELTP